MEIKKLEWKEVFNGWWKDRLTGWLFRGLEIPDHDFGVKLLSQFLEVE